MANTHNFASLAILPRVCFFASSWAWLFILAIVFAARRSPAAIPRALSPTLFRNASNAGEMRAALEESRALQLPITISIVDNIKFDQENWPDPPIVVSQSVTISSPYRSKLDFCGSRGAAARPLLNVTGTGSLLLQRVFLRNFLPSVPQDLSLLGPVPALLSTGGPITFKLVVFHFLPAVTWAFNTSSAAPDAAPPGFWALNGPTSMTNVYTLAPPQLSYPALYQIRYQSPADAAAKYQIDNCFAPMDLRSCYDDDREDTTLVYCLYTMADSLRNPAVRYARVFHDIGLDRAAYARANPLVVRQPKSFSACPGSAPTLNLDGILYGVQVRSTLELSGLRIKGSLATNFTSWPPALPLLLSTYDVQDGGSVWVSDSVVEVGDLGATVAGLQSLPGCCSADPSRPNLQPVVDAWPTAADLSAAAKRMRAPAAPSGGAIVGAWLATAPPAPSAPPLAPAPPSPAGGGSAFGSTATRPPGFIITQWVLQKNSWVLYSSPDMYAALGAPVSASWRFTNVLVQQADGANDRALCFGAALEQGATVRGGIAVVANETQLRAALQRARYIQIVSDIKLTPEVWPSSNNALVPSGGMIEVRACHPVPGQRFTVDASDLQDVIRSAGGRLIFEGDLRFVGVGWTAVPPSLLLQVATGAIDMSIVGAFRVAANTLGVRGSVEFEGALIEGRFSPDGLRPADLLAVMHLSHITPSIRAANVTLRGGNSGVTLGVWNVSFDATQAGNWVFTQSDVTWSGPGGGSGGGNGTRPGGPGAKGQGGGPDVVGGEEDIRRIVVPCVVIGGVLLIAVAVLGTLFVRNRRRRTGKLGDKSPRASGKAGSGGGGDDAADAAKDFRKSLSSSIAQALAQAPSLAAAADSGANGTGGDAAAAAALAAVLQAASKMLGSTPGSTASASGTRTDVSGAAVAAALAALERLRTEHRDAAAPAPAPAVVERKASGLRPGGMGPRGKDRSPLADITAVRRAILAGRPVPHPDVAAQLDDLVLQSVLGEGSYGRVYRALWRGTTVAVKVILLPANMGGRERHERMAVMEAAISSSLSHPNIVQTYTYVVESVEGAKARSMGMHGSRAANSALPDSSTAPVGSPEGCGAAAGGGAAAGAGAAGHPGGGGADAGLDLMGWEIRLVQEFCDLGSLRDKLNARVFFKPAPVASAFAGAGAVASGHISLPIPHAGALTSPPPSSRGGPATGGGGGIRARLAAVLAAGGEMPPPTGSGSAEATPTAGPAAAPPSSPASAAGLPYVGPNGGVDDAAVAAAVCGNARAPSGAISSGAAADGAGGRGSSGGQSRGMVVDLAAVLDTAIDVARALTHLHRQGIVHADLKPRNVLLKGSTSDPRGFVAKVADFGLSMRLDADETHVSNAYHGTLAYMAPETLLHGHVSRASDVYGFGILLYELYTGDTAFKGIPKALIGHSIAKENLRPVFPPALEAPFEYQLLACRCWESNPEIRPEFEFILEDLKRMRTRLCAPLGDNSSRSTAGHHPCIPSALLLSPGGPGGGGCPPPTAARSRLAGATGYMGAADTLPSSQQGGPFLMMTHTGGGFTDGERTLSISQSVTMSAMSATAGPSTSPANVSVGAAGAIMAGAVMARQLMVTSSRGAAGAGAGLPPLVLPSPAVGTAAAATLPRAGGGGGGGGRGEAKTHGAVPYGNGAAEVEAAEDEEVRVRSL